MHMHASSFGRWISVCGCTAWATAAVDVAVVHDLAAGAGAETQVDTPHRAPLRRQLAAAGPEAPGIQNTFRLHLAGAGAGAAAIGCRRSRGEEIIMHQQQRRDNGDDDDDEESPLRAC